MVGEHIRRVVGGGITQVSTHMTTKDYEGQISVVLGNPAHIKQDMAAY
jgi:vancomycin resistance protein YoaR